LYEKKGFDTHHVLDDDRHQRRKERPNIDAELLSRISRTPPQYPPENISTSNVIRHAAITQRECECANMVGDDSVGGVNAIYIVGAKAPFVRTNAGEFSDLVKNGKEDICIVIGSPVLDGRD